MRMAETIKDMLTIRDVLVRYGYSEGKHGRAPCPLHHGKGLNFSYTDKVFHCFVCGAGGDVIRLVQDLHGIGFRQALVKINSDFSLGLTSRKPSFQDCAAQRDNERVEASYQSYMSEKKACYNGATAAYRHLVDRIRAGDNDPETIRAKDELEKILDDNLDEGVIDWR